MIAVKLDKARNLLFGFEALRLFKANYGKSLLKIDFSKEDDIEDIFPLIIYCGLKHEDNDLTVEKTVELIDEYLGIRGTLELLPKILKELNLKGEDEQKNALKVAGKKK